MSDMATEIADVYNMGVNELFAKFEELYGFQPGNTSIVTIRNRIIYRIQETYLDGVALEDREFLKSIAARDPMANLVRKPQNKVSKVAGSRYERVWKGKKYEVTVLGKDRFEFDGEIYTSLSAVARAITGTRWNGKVFFGVK
jgi:hypothetical protein